MKHVDDTERLKVAQQKTEALLAADPSRQIADPTLPVYQLVAQVEIERLRLSYENGDLVALFAAIRKCANHGLVMPEWVAKGFINRYDKVLNCRVGSWDSAFGRPFPKGAQLAALRKRRNLRLKVVGTVRKLLSENEHQSIDRGLFELVGAQLHIGQSVAEKLYYEAINRHGLTGRPKLPDLKKKRKYVRRVG